jgi:ATP-dependent RNA helicase UAP56/SUB2
MRDLVVERRALDLGKLRFFILDESDQMIDDLKMRNDIQDIFYKTPQDKQFMAFSATFTENSRGALKKFIADNKPVAPNSYSDLRNHHPSRATLAR